ncbi:uncharacterized protein LOC128672234 isoform X2 [Plodia interpunctella]|uniref:uncharacterized protein LOC128672234 isoform X2 n=2 Tax=Plodia interpunctella TaxID=58824 RepID=UPI002368ADC4|nr:uncharacterized protein LOC128672234 isoform X2 [Plodia interpunctella]
MSDNLKDIAKHYEGNVFPEHPQSIGLFTIPEFPEFEQRGMWSAALSAIFTTLRYLAPATLLTLFWGQHSFLFKLLKHIDSAFRAIFSSEEQKQDVLQWLNSVGPVKATQLDTVWRHGWIVCGVLDAALPGACAGHPPTKLSLKHAQAIADHYLGVEPVFSRQELESNDSLSKHQEWKLATYLDRLREALTKITPPVSKPTSQRTSPEATQFTIDYVAKGSGLAAAQVNNTMSFKIYPTAQQSLDPGEITILIRGPKDTYGMAVLPPILGKAQLIRQKLLGLQTKPNYTENALPITQGATYLRNYGKNDMNKTYHIPKTKYDIEIENEVRSDHIKISYFAPFEGRYEIFITSRGQNIAGSPFLISASNNIISLLEKENYSLEDGEEIDIVDVKTDRKVVLRIVDFVTEKMLLRENGSLEKITDDEAKILMTTDTGTTKMLTSEATTKNVSQVHEKRIESTCKSVRFRNVLQKVVTMVRVCRIWSKIVAEKRSIETEKSMTVKSRNNKYIPDIVNSTFTDSNIDPYVMRETRDKLIIPENISVSILTEKCQPGFVKNKPISEARFENSSQNLTDDTCSPDSIEEYIQVQTNIENDLFKISQSPNNNPFLNETYEQNYKIEKELGSYVANEYETNNSQNEETPDAPIKIIVEENDFLPPINSNPFIDINLIERPKSPVFKIISGEIKSRVVSPVPLDEEEIGNEFINPFFVHQHHQSSELDAPLPIADFIIGAPVSLPPLLRASSPVPEMESLLINEVNQEKMQNIKDEENESCEYSTPLHTNQSKAKDNINVENNNVSSTFHSLDDANITESTVSNKQCLETYNVNTTHTCISVTPKREIWDSAYVSIDDNNSSPDSNNNDNTPLCEAINKQKFSPSDNNFGLAHDEFLNMGPAEREIWQTCNELKDNMVLSHDDVRMSKTDIKRPIFTPIIEECDRSLSSTIKEKNKSVLAGKNKESDAVTVAFAELNDIYQEYFPTTKKDYFAKANEEDKIHYADVENGNDEDENRHVNSASESETDVKRQMNELEGKISEVQANATESVSVSQTLHENQTQNNVKSVYKNELQFGDNKSTNIVLERKKYWDEKIRQIEAKSEESTTLQKKRRLSSRHLRNNDSLTKRRGKHIVKNFLNAEQDKSHIKANAIINRRSPIPQEVSTSTNQDKEPHTEVKLVDKWKNYWDSKLTAENNEKENKENSSCFRTKSPKSLKSPTSSKSPTSTKSSNSHKSLTLPTTQVVKSNEDTIEAYNEIVSETPVPVKHELPEEVFKAFETSPKRFFGTSRKQILNKIDTFLGKPSTVDKSSADEICASRDSGLVSNRISMFHKISNTEDVSWSRRKCQSLHNISHGSDKNLFSSQKNSEIIKHKYNDSQVIQPTGNLNTDMDDSRTDIKKTQNKSTLKDKRAKVEYKTFNRSFDETTLSQELDELRNQNKYVKRTIKDLNQHDQNLDKYKKSNELRKSSISRSEMDIFNKAIKATDDDLDKYKSCDELPKINVKNFISLYESVSSTTKPSTAVGKLGKNIFSSQMQVHNNSTQGAITSSGPSSIMRPRPYLTRSRTYTSSENMSIDSGGTRTTSSLDIENVTGLDKETTYVSLSDIELEIVESPDKCKESTPKLLQKDDTDKVKKDYKSRFKIAKEFFQSLEEIGPVKKPPKINECQAMLQSTSTESLESKQKKRPKSKVGKSHSMPSSEFARIWNEMKDEDSNKLVKISEKFNVDDLFTDVTEGKLSRQGSLRGIPHKKAVLEAFRSMENVSDNTISPYEMAVSQQNDIAQDKEAKKAQTYLSEYPYLPTTCPSMYHSRIDAKASGLISLKELKDMKRPRRNSVPDLRLNPTFTADL